ncbi:MAG: hypothetical protein OEM52_09920 [bacterium]|nr:hypothetical protein [bacterium]
MNRIAPETNFSGITGSMVAAVRIGVWSATVVAVGYLLVFLPNIEGVSITVALAGATLGWRSGIAIGAIGEGLYSLLNPWGPPGVFLLIAQVLGVALLGGVAGFYQKVFPGTTLLHRLGWGLVGLLMSIVFDVITVLSFPLLAGMEKVSLTTILVMQIPFTAVKAAVNTVLFFVAIVPLRDKLQVALAQSLFRRVS